MTGAAPQPYAPRATFRLANWRIGALDLKVWWIDVKGKDDPPPDLLTAAKAHAADVLPAAVAQEGEAMGLGFITLHRGEVGIWMSMHWWAHDDICCQLLSRSDPDALSFVPQDRPLMACVWELDVITVERDAWVAALLTGTPDPAAYLSAEPAA